MAEEFTAKFKIDISDLKKGISDATKAIKQANATFKAETAGMDAWAKDADGLTKKLNSLDSVLTAQKKILASYREQLARQQEAYTENGRRADELRKKLQQLADQGVAKTDAEYQRYRKALTDVSREQSNNARTIDDLNGKILQEEAAIGSTEREIRHYASSLETVERESRSLTRTVEAQEAELEDLRREYIDVVAAQGRDSSAAQDLAKKIQTLSGDLDRNKKSLSDAEKEADKLGGTFEQTEKKAGNLAEKLATGLKRALAIAGSALAAGAVKIGKDAFEAYSEYEQLVGGVETLFGDSSEELMKYARNAYKTAGLSANDYMSTVTSFSASLLQGLEGDTEEAVRLADMAITDMSDNANKMGTDISSIQSAYVGFAKQTYQLLDNLKLGYGGSASEMARLVNDSKVLGDTVKVTDRTVKDVPFDKIIQAIHEVQTQIGITGTTMREAESTIEGSSKAVRSAWQNLLIDIASDNADMEKSVDRFVDSVVKYVDNAGPRLKKIVSGIWTAVVDLSKKYAPKFTNKIVPVVKKIRDAVVALFTFIKNNANIIIAALAGIAAGFAAFKVASMVTTLVSALKSMTTALRGAAVAQTTLNTAMNSNPILLVISLVAGLIAIIATLIIRSREAAKAVAEWTAEEEKHRESVDKLIDSVNNEASAWEDLKESQGKQYAAGLAQMGYYEDLRDELSGIVDENGKIIDGYEDRASFIASTLSEALGVEIQINDGVIEKYGEVSAAIDELMKKERAQIMLRSQQGLYEEAILNQQSATEKLLDLETALADVEKARSEDVAARAAMTKQMELAWEEGGEAERARWNRERDIIDERLKAWDEEVDALKSSIAEQEDTISEYAYNVGQYEKNMELAHKGEYDKMTYTNWEYARNFQSGEESKREQLEETRKVQERQLDDLRRLREKSGSTLYDAQIRQAEKNLAATEKEIADINYALENGMARQNVVWSKGLAKNLSEITGARVQFKKGAEGHIEMYIDGIKAHEADGEEEMAKFVENAIKGVTKGKPDAVKAGEDLIDGVNNGIANQDKQSSVFSAISRFGSSILSRLKTSLQEQSPSKATREMGQYLLEGLGLGMEDEEKSTLKEAGEIGENVVKKIADSAMISPIRSAFSGLFGWIADGLSGAIKKAGRAQEREWSGVSYGWAGLAARGAAGARFEDSLRTATAAAAAAPASRVTETTNNFTQVINAPEAPSRLELYRQTRNLLELARGM